MKTMILATMLAVSTQVVADDDKVCNGLAKFAEAVMSAHQKGTPAAVVYGLAGKDPMAAEVVRRAFETPRHEDRAAQKQEAARFRDTWHRECVRKFTR